jgi:hypothetical protein
MMPPDRLMKMMEYATGRRKSLLRMNTAYRWNELDAIRNEAERGELRTRKGGSQEEFSEPAETIRPAHATPASQAHP